MISVKTLRYFCHEKDSMRPLIEQPFRQDFFGEEHVFATSGRVLLDVPITKPLSKFVNTQEKPSIQRMFENHINKYGDKFLVATPDTEKLLSFVDGVKWKFRYWPERVDGAIRVNGTKNVYALDVALLSLFANNLPLDGLTMTFSLNKEWGHHAIKLNHREWRGLIMPLSQDNGAIKTDKVLVL